MGLFSWIGKFMFGFVSDRVFDKVDANKNGQLEGVEIELAVVYMYSAINKVAKIGGRSVACMRSHII